MQPRRPLYIVALAVFFTTALVIVGGEQNGWPIALCAALLLAVVLCIPALRRVGVLYLVLFGVVLSSLGTYLHFTTSVLPLADFDGELVTVTARVRAVTVEQDTRYVLTVADSDLLPKGTLLSVTDDVNANLPKYGFVRGTVFLYTSHSAALHGDGIFLTGSLDAVYRMSPPQPTVLERITDGIRGRFLDAVYAVMPDARAAFIAGVCMGDVSSVSADVITDFRKSGLAHLTVVSGLHMTVLSGAVLGLLRSLRVRRWVTAVVTLATVWLFMLTVGLSVSVIRAAVMLHCLLIGGIFRRRADSRTSLSVALLLIVSVNPYAVCDVGFLLSFAATWGLIVLVPLWNKWTVSFDFIAKRRWLQNALQPIGCSLAAMVFTAPICAKVFGTLSVLSPLANLLTGWPVTIMLPAAFLGGILYQLPFLHMLATPILWLSGVLAEWIMSVARWIASLSVTVLQIRHPVWLLLLVLFPFCLSWAAKLYGKRGVWRVVIANVAVVSCLLVAFSCFFRRYVSVRVAGSGYASVTVAETASFTAAVISGENAYAYDTAKRYFTAFGVDAVDVLVVTDSGKETDILLTDLLKTVSAKTVVCSADDALPATTLLKNGETFTYGDMLSLTTIDGWWRMDIGGTRVLFTADGRVGEMPADWQRTHLAVVRQTAPEDISQLYTQHIVAMCTAKNAAKMKTALENMQCPTTVNEQITFFTAGQGDLVPNTTFWL